ncbi:hypothetical protein H4219_002995 [Mycoemilia scoparia]|uniref:J domain-containing protein n=1 Tax=Mycoemilia scoparia TaxID=417184 RepID=A0A9W8A428_9FUNG|nr:hypothetical protein H4219_002995 [Mycoemilia scoparia]
MVDTSKRPFGLDNVDGDDGAEISLYQILEVDEKATADEIKKAYRKLALRTHPDKIATMKDEGEKERCTQQFQQLGFAYAILSDKKKRKRYDETGSTEDLDNEFFEEGKDWDAYFRELWSGVVDATTIEEFAKKYRGSSEEQNDVIKAYEAGDGDIDYILSHVMLASVEEEPRLVAIIEDAIKAKKIQRTKAYSRSKRLAGKRRKEADAEAKEAEQLRKELGLDEELRKIKEKKQNKRKSSDDDSDSESDSGTKNKSAKTKRGSRNGKKSKKQDGSDEDNDEEAALKSLIRKRSIRRMDNIVAKLEAKYASPKKGSKKGTAKSKQIPQEPSEEEFQALQAKLFGKEE